MFNAAIRKAHQLVTNLKNSGNQARYHSRFGGLWTDRLDAEYELARKKQAGAITPAQEEQLKFWMKNGFIIIPGAVPLADIDALNADIDRAWETLDDRYQVQKAHGDYAPLSKVERNRVLAKLLDVYVHSEAGSRVSLSPKISDFLKLIFERDVLAFQNLTFEVGSTQAIHQDTAYVVASKPMELAASWVALEDIQEGSGELMYYPGSHRFPDHIFGGAYKHWNPERDGKPAHDEFLKALHAKAKERGFETQKFRPKKGDALIWSADLAHGGGPITDQSLTRKSYVTHYCPVDVKPNYFSYQPERAKMREVAPGGYISSSFYTV